MKRSDVAIIILLVSIALVVGYFVGQALFSGPGHNKATIDVVEKISTEVDQPDKSVFNSQANNPAVPITIGNSSNQQPFNGSN